MTMIGLHASGNRADMITDTLSYTRDMKLVGHVSKTMPLIHLDAAWATQGCGRFGSLSAVFLLSESNGWGDFDEMAVQAPNEFRKVWTSDWLDDTDRQGAARGFLIGFSPTQEQFVAYRYDFEHDFEAVAIEGGFALTPTPWTYRPSEVEAARLRAELVKFGPGVDSEEDIDAMVTNWLNSDPIAPPTNVNEWRDLAKLVRKTRALMDFAKVPVGGKVVHTQVRRGSITNTVIHKYDDSGAEFLNLIQGSSHPLAGEAPCPVCESGLPWKDCHSEEAHPGGVVGNL